MEIDCTGLQRDYVLKTPWNECAYCRNVSFKTLPDFTRHLREKHCTIEGGSFTCHYGYNSVCNSLPVEGVSDSDYAEHVYKQHVLSQMISEHEEGARVNRKLSASNDHGSSLEHSIRWTIYSAKQNLATVLNDPNRGKQKDYFTKSWGLDFTEKNSSEIPKHPYLPDINRSHFESYLKKILKRHKRHLKLQEELSSKMVCSASNEVLQLFPKLRLRKMLSNDKKMMDKPEVSGIFLRPDFDISNADTFYLIFPFSKEDKPENETFQHNRKVMQEKLTHDLDQVEVLIAEQVSQKSEAFFQAMTSHDSLMDQLASTLSVVQSLRQKISVIDKALVKHSLFLIQLYRRKQNHITVLQKLKLMGTVQQTQPTIQALLSTPDYLAALELISTTQELLNEELKGIHSFRHLGSQLNEINRLIDMMMMTEFENYLARDLNRDLSQDVQVLEKEKLTSIILGMLRRKNVKFILKYKEEIFTTIKTIVKQLVFEALADNDFDIDGPYTVEKVQLLNLSEWIDLINKITTSLVKFLNRVEAVVKIMKEAVCMAAGQTSNLSSEKTTHVEDDAEKLEDSKIRLDVNSEMCFLTVKECTSLTNDLKELLVSACDFSNDECAKILTALAKGKSSKEKFPPKGSDRFLSNGSTSIFNDVDLKQIHRLSKIIETFTIECEKLCSKTPTSLKSAFQHQANKFLNKFHNERKDRLNLILENECWRPAEVPRDFQTLIDDVSNFKTPLKTRLSTAKEGSIGTCLVVKNAKYVVVGSVLALIQLTIDYIDLAQGLPILTLSALRSLAELLSHYNSRTCQLILGAGALHTVGLKTITTTNLVLTSRSLQLIIWLLPYIKYCFGDLLSLGNQISSNGSSIKSNTNINILNDVEVNIKDHINKLHAKVVLVVSNVVTNEVANWAAKPPVPSSSFRNISKHLAKLHEAVAGVLPSDQIQELYIKIHESFKGALREQLKKLNIVNNGGPQHGTVTSEMIFYSEMLKKLNIFESDNFFDHLLNDIWSCK